MYLTLASLLAASPAISAERGYQIHQYSSLVGPHTLWITPTSIKLVDINNKLSVIARAPDWKVFYCNDKNKTYCETTSRGLEQSGGARLYFVYRLDLQSPNWKEAAGKPRDGMDTVERTLHVFHNSMEGTDASKHWVKGITNAESIEAKNFPITPQVDEIFSKMLVVPPLKRLPIDFRFLSYSGGEKMALKTEKIQSHTFSAQDFTVPPGYKKIKEQRLIAGSSSAGVFLENMGGFFSDDKDETAKPPGHK
ncbi:MAG TPA: hypothetical protein V6C81_02240 [Planktothrix sp.]|jgi:hypothetical protein